MIHSFLLIGQSNMAGRGFLNEGRDIDNNHIFVLRSGRWHKMYRPVNCDCSYAGVSLAESFAEAYAKKYGVDVGLIPCADGDTSLEQWKVGGLLFDHAVYQAKLAQRTSTIAGVLWHQGEADCAPQRAASYQERFEKIMVALRKELDLYDVPFLLGGLGDFLSQCSLDSKLKNYEIVNKQLEQVVKNNSMTGFVSAAGLAPNPDNLHFCASALYDFGLRYFEIFETLRDANKVFNEKNSMDDAVRTEMERL